MKVIIYLAVIFCFISCKSNIERQEQLSEEDKNSNSDLIASKATKQTTLLTIDKELILKFDDNEMFEDQGLETYEVGTGNSDLDSNGEFDRINYSKCKGWENEPGDFTRIAVSLNGEEPAIHDYYGGWVKVPSQFSEYTVHGFAMYLDIKPNRRIAILFGYVYESQPGYLSIYTVNSNKFELIFNQKLRLLEVVNLGEKDGYKLIVDNLSNQKYEIFIEGDELKFMEI